MGIESFHIVSAVRKIEDGLKAHMYNVSNRMKNVLFII